MPAITHYKTTKETLGGNTLDNEAIPVDKYRAFLASDKIEHDTEGNTYRSFWLEWSPSFPCADYVPCTTITEEALYRSNWRVVHKSFEELGEELQTERGAGIFRFRPGETHCIALACYWETLLEEYPVADEEDVSELETELIEEAYKDYGRADFIKALAEYEEVKWFIDPENDEWCETGGILPAVAEHVENYIEMMARSSVGYSGEMYPSASALVDALRDILYPVKFQHGQERLPAMLTALGERIKLKKAMQDQAKHEETQLVLVDVPRDNSMEVS